jgi:uncharacterized phage protein gp47/JayE
VEMDDLVLIPDFEVEEIDVIHDRILSNINDRYDKTEGQFVWDETRPVAVEVQNGQIDIQNMYYDNFLNSSMSSNQLTLACRNFGVDRKGAVASSQTVTFNGTDGTLIPAGTILRFIADDVVEFTSSADATITSGTASVLFTCSEGGTIGNIPANTLQLAETISGVTSITHPAFDNGVDEESNEALLERTLDKLRNPGISGNKAHYRQWAMSRPGVADAKVYPVWDGTNSVKVVLLDENGKAPSQSIIDDVTAYIESVMPGDPRLTVVGVTEVPINVSATVQPASYSDVTTVTQQFIEAAEEYLKTLAFVDPLVRWTRIANLLGDIPDVIDYSNLTINGGTANIEILDGSVAVLGTVTFT